MNKSIKKWLVLLLVAVIALTALTLVACDGLFGGGDQKERLEIINSGGEVPEDVTDETIKMYIMVQYYDKKGNGTILNERDFSVVQFEIVDYDVNVAVKYNNLTAFGFYYIHREIIKDHTHVDFIPNDQYNTVIPSQDLNMGECVREPNTPYWENATFLGWFTKDVNQDGTINWTKWDFSKPITWSGENTLFLYGRWEQLVTINYYDDVDGEIYATEQVNVWDNDEAPELPNDPTKKNYAFEGWYFYEESDERDWHPSFVFWLGTATDTIDVYPKYLATFNVVFDTNGGDPIEPLVVKDGEPFNAPATATKDGYKFACWSMYDVRATESYRSNKCVFADNYWINEQYELSDGQLVGLEAGATFTVYAEFYKPDVPTEGLHFEYYQNFNGQTDESKYMVSRAPQTGDTMPWETTVFAVVIPSTYNGKPVVGIGGGTFLENYNLIAVIMPDTITEIQNSAFGRCYNLKDVTLSSNIKSIGDSAFVGCHNADFELPEGLISIGAHAFRSTAFSGSLPSTLKTIGAYAFGGNTYTEAGTLVTSVVLPAGLETLGEGAFARCSNLTSVTLNATCQIGANAFYGCSKLTDVTIPEGIENLPNSIFAGCSSLVSIRLPSSLEHIGDDAFNGAKLTSLTLPNGLLSIGKSAFEGNNITKVVIPSNVTEISARAFYNCKLLESVTLPQGILSIGNEAFYNDSNLTSINIPNSVTTIGSSAFEYCSGLTNVTMSESVEYIGSYAFAYCRGLTSVNLAHVQTVGERAFYNCSALTTLTMSDKVEEISSYAFKGTKINFGALTLPNTLELIGREAFSGCAITSINVNSEPELLISAYAFDGVDGLLSASLLGNIKSIGAYAFSASNELTTVTLSNEIKTIDENAFANCSLKTLAFKGELVDWLNVQLNDTLFADNGVTITFNGRELTGSVPVSPKAGETLTIGQYALQGLNKVTTFTLSGVDSIGQYAFYGCAELTNVYLDFADGAVSVSRNAFDKCDKLQYNEYNNGLYLGNRANEHYLFVKPASSDIAELNLHADTKMIANNALRYEEYPNLTSITLPEGLQVIGEGAFYGCNLVTELVVPDSVVYIGEGAFEGWDALKRLTIPFVGEKKYSNTLNTKLSWIFGGDSKSNKYPSKLEYVEVTGGIIGQNAFENCTSLKTLNAGKTTRVLMEALKGCNNLETLIVPTSITYVNATGTQMTFHAIDGYFNPPSKAPASLKNITITGGGELDISLFGAGGAYVKDSYDTLTLGIGVTKVEGTVLSYVTIGALYYEGTMDQWKQIATGDWSETTITVVHCSDGDVSVPA